MWWITVQDFLFFLYLLLPKLNYQKREEETLLNDYLDIVDIFSENMFYRRVSDLNCSVCVLECNCNQW